MKLNEITAGMATIGDRQCMRQAIYSIAYQVKKIRVYVYNGQIPDPSGYPKMSNFFMMKVLETLVT